ncbi:HAD-IA family hydrolase [Jiangella mangrovi]|uniref:Putative hydrolase of the HAD superfamily n=1 Tax=Jiangella mangrovi TaxID=1524084 RepID=A0A7W9GNB7_9ACTN|nr:HAD-IA family hydrolase [Jiangella mangrovi]MBB5787010.1 putative hydrolase of the HAD superfamily [Jiangella mangrovi]
MGLIDVLLLDLDGVVRHYDPAATDAIEKRSGLSPGKLHETAFEPRLLQRVVTGGLTRAQWVDHVAAAVGPVAATAWATQRPSVDREVLATIRRLRVAGVKVCLLTNGTDRIGAELAELRIADDFDEVFNSAEIGVAKPDLRIFMHVLRVLGVPRSSVLFLDDSQANVRGASAVGMRAHLFTSASDLTDACKTYHLA